MLPERQARALVDRGRYLTRRERQCVGKGRRGERSAREEAARLVALGEDRIVAYQCPQCGSWHVGKRGVRTP